MGNYITIVCGVVKQQRRGDFCHVLPRAIPWPYFFVFCRLQSIFHNPPALFLVTRANVAPVELTQSR